MPRLYVLFVLRRWLGGGFGRVGGQLVGQRGGAVNIAQRLEYAARIDADGSSHRVVKDEVPRQRLDVPVKDDANHLRVLVDSRRARVAADDVAGVDEVQ